MSQDVIRQWISRRLNFIPPNGLALRSHVKRALATARMEQLLREATANIRVPGIAASLLANGVVISAAVGTRNVDRGLPLQSSTLFEPGEMTRMIVAGVAHELVAAGRLHIESTITHYLPELDCGSFLDDISVANLMSHTSGYLGPNPFDLDLLLYYSWPDFVGFLNSTYRLFRPGTVFNRLDTEVVILGEIIQRATGHAVLSTAEEMFLKSLGVDARSSVNERVSGHIFAANEGRMRVIEPLYPCDFWQASSLAPSMSVEQLAKLGQVLFAGGNQTVSDKDERTDAQAAIMRRCIRIPDQLRAPGSREVPRYACFGCEEFADGIFGVSSSARGQCVGIRAVPGAKVTVAAGINAQLPGLLDTVMEQILSDICGIPRRPRESTLQMDVSIDEIGGQYQAANSHRLNVAINDDHVAIEEVYNPWVPSESARFAGLSLRVVDRNTVEIAERGFGTSIGLFRDPSSGIPCISVGASTFGKMG